MLNHPLTGIISAAICLGLAFVAGMRVSSNAHDAALLEQQRKAEEEFRAFTQIQADRSQKISKELANERRKREAEGTAFRDALRRARAAGVPMAVCPPQDQPGPSEPLFSAQFVWLWNSATDPASAAGADPSGVDGAAASAGVVGPDEVLDVHQANAVIARECRAKLIQWQALARENDWAK